MDLVQQFKHGIKLFMMNMVINLEMLRIGVNTFQQLSERTSFQQTVN